jgi:hypothetical protein
MLFILLEKNPVPVATLRDVYRWLDSEHNDVKIIQFSSLPGSVDVSTVFLFVATSYDKLGRPELFETMIFGGTNHHMSFRSATYDDALLYHQKAVNLC